MVIEKLIVNHFGPIQKADLDLRKVTVFIGEQASGKSILAKLVAIMRRHPFLEQANKNRRSKTWWRNQFEYFGLDEFQPEISTIAFKNEDFSVDFANSVMKPTFVNKRLKVLIKGIADLETLQNEIDEASRIEYEQENYEKATQLGVEKNQNAIALLKLKSELKLSFLASEYIPAERVLLSFMRCHHFEDLYLDDFIQKFKDKRVLKRKIPIFPLNMAFHHDEDAVDENWITHADAATAFPLHKAASGIQSLVPLSVFMETINPKQKYQFIIEEPELNLYPTTQKKVVEYLIEKCTKSDNRLIITTHSPYVLTTLSNLIQAKNVLKLHPEKAKAIHAIVPPQQLLDFDDVAVYFVANGAVKSLRDEAFQNIDATPLDSISDELGAAFDKLLDLEFKTTSQ
jgi:predicted ATPase